MHLPVGLPRPGAGVFFVPGPVVLGAATPCKTTVWFSWIFAGSFLAVAVAITFLQVDMVTSGRPDSRYLHPDDHGLAAQKNPLVILRGKS